MPLLDGRLLITPPEGSKDSARPHDIMGAPPSAVAETRLMVQQGAAKLVVFSEEVFARPGPDLVGALKDADPRVADLPMTERTLARGLRAVIVSHPSLRAADDVAPVAHAYTVLPDDTLQVTHVLVNSDVVRAGSSGCSALAERILASLRPGPRKLDLAGGVKDVGNGYALTLPPAFVMIHEAGPDFDVYRVFPLNPISTPTGQLGIYFGGHASFERDPQAKAVAGKLFGKAVTWQEARSGAAVRRETLVEFDGGLHAHVFLAAPKDVNADELQHVAETLKKR